ncbi:hypothetical protein ABGB17_34470 [Sphaerisporangium sp. B11E5]|uniref:hypothetical protein n=1 Tax=Sphaerisporangium sp. B11E5 TaxID=3153563 RepID=UPI00325C5A94
MRPFLHERLRRYEELLELSNDAFRAYSALDLGLGDAVLRFLDGASSGYQAIGAAGGENDMLALKAQFVSARAGVHPLTFERVTQRRRETERAMALHVLVRGAERLRGDHAEVQRTLAETRDQLLPLLAYLAQKGVLSLAPGRPRTQPELEHVWRSLLDDPEAGPAARRIALSLNPADILLMLADLLTG